MLCPCHSLHCSTQNSKAETRPQLKSSCDYLPSPTNNPHYSPCLLMKPTDHPAPVPAALTLVELQRLHQMQYTTEGGGSQSGQRFYPHLDAGSHSVWTKQFFMKNSFMSSLMSGVLMRCILSQHMISGTVLWQNQQLCHRNVPKSHVTSSYTTSLVSHRRGIWLTTMAHQNLLQPLRFKGQGGISGWGMRYAEGNGEICTSLLPEHNMWRCPVHTPLGTLWAGNPPRTQQTCILSRGWHLEEVEI